MQTSCPPERDTVNVWRVECGRTGRGRGRGLRVPRCSANRRASSVRRYPPRLVVTRRTMSGDPCKSYKVVYAIMPAACGALRASSSSSSSLSFVFYLRHVVVKAGASSVGDTVPAAFVCQFQGEEGRRGGKGRGEGKWATGEGKDGEGCGRRLVGGAAESKDHSPAQPQTPSASGS